ncbi:hypothetical protein RRF57_012967 [Xylaria bambusicola]|uniref:Uncharacterized protein n=1 Tax=Xylaria bambusicola TaxID=326684 RepID=A0AAN7UQY3_9PEZI
MPRVNLRRCQILQTLGEAGRLGKRGNVKVHRRQLVDGGADSLKMIWHPSVVNILSEPICSPLLFTIQFCKREVTDWVAVVLSFLPIDHRVVAIDTHRLVVMRDRERKDPPVDLILAPNKTKKLNNSSCSHRHTVGVLAVRNVQCCGAALHLTG